MARYAAVSGEVMAVLATLSPRVEPVSIDEAYLDVSGLERLIGPPELIGRRAKDAIQAAVGLTASVGIGPNRLIAKLASEARKPDGLTVVSPEQVSAFLDPMPLTVLRGLGVKTAPRLQRLGLKTVGALRALPLEALRRHLGAQAGTAIYQQARGIADDEVYPERARQSISKESTFGEDVTDPTVLRETLRWAAQEVGFLARHGGYQGRVVRLKIRLHPFETHTRSRTLPVPTASDTELFGAAWALYQAEPWAGRPVRLIGLGLSGWAEGTPEQPDLFAAEPLAPQPRAERLDETLDAIRERFGAGSVRRGTGPGR
jgi:DNA polymerase-4